MKLSVNVGLQVDFRRVKEMKNGEPGQVHITVNGAPICEYIGKGFILNHTSGYESRTALQFMDDPCTLCYERSSGLTREQAKAEIAAYTAA